ncbi:hypothetical protein [Halobacterium salinarum]|uniref:hypothetical protein n=1 Tax=Halobacterium salinarum TaxID=2242 RepID=UPI00255318AC|nr:hypothetical protein [Halobacterium salinarum]
MNATTKRELPSDKGFILWLCYIRIQMAITKSEFKQVLREEVGSPSDLTEEGREVARELVVLPD